MKKAIIYARYSSELQSCKSVNDQLAEAREYAARSGYTIYKEYADEAFSVGVLKPPGIEAILEEARKGRFNILICEATDRLSRDQEHLAHIHKHLKFNGVQIDSLTEGVVDEMIVAFKGYVNSNFNIQLGHKVRRGLKGRAKDGLPAGGRHYGYRAQKSVVNEKFVTGRYVTIAAECAVVRRIFADYAMGKSPFMIATELNREGIPSPTGKEWTPKSINGDRATHRGILNCELFIGKYVWNKCSRVKDPRTGNKISRPKPESEWVVADMPELRVIDQELWDRVKAKQREFSRSPSLRERVRAVKLLSGLMVCRECGSKYIVTGADHIQCGKARDKGLCDNRKMVRYGNLEQAVLNALQTEVMGENLAEEFYEDYLSRMEAVQERFDKDRARHEAELAKTNGALAKLTDAIINGGIDISLIREKMNSLGQKRDELIDLLKSAFQAPAALSPTLATVYRKGTRQLVTALQTPEKRQASISLLRELIKEVGLTPTADRTDIIIDLKGNADGILRLSQDPNRTIKLNSTGAAKFIAAPQPEQTKPVSTFDDSTDSVLDMPLGATCFTTLPRQMTGASVNGEG